MRHYFQQDIVIRENNNKIYSMFLHDFIRHVFERKWQGPLKVPLISNALVENRPIICYL
jgi:hypothetical protein